MHVTNSPIWLALEDYALDHAREDEMKISVFTGPYLERLGSRLSSARAAVGG
jgi:endonuclease G